MQKYQIFLFKRFVEELIMKPFVFLGRMIAKLKPLDQSYDIFFIFPFYTIGGAERINAEIVKSFPDKKSIIFFTKKSANNGMRHFFHNSFSTIHEISRWTDCKWIYFMNFIYRGIISGYINNQKETPIVFNGQSNFGYKVLPHIKKGIRKIELIHAYDPVFTYVWAPFISYIDSRIIIGDVFFEKFKKCYEQEGIPLNYLDRIVKIEYRLVYIPQSFTFINYTYPLKVYYAGRGGRQKRLWILFKIIEESLNLKLPFEFHLAGSFENELTEQVKANVIYHGELNGGEEMYEFHKNGDILLMTSAFEGFPIVIMEAMSWGAIPLVPAVDAIPEHIQDKVNGFLIDETFDEEAMIKETIGKLRNISELSSEKLNEVSNNAFEYIHRFSSEKFQNAYRKLFYNTEQ
ncbi:MAG: glycosyltransferase family 4 protein [Chitinophagales bacterium]